MNTQKISDDKYIKCSIDEDGLEVSIKYSKRSTLEKRFEMLEKLKEVIRKI